MPNLFPWLRITIEGSMCDGVPTCEDWTSGCNNRFIAYSNCVDLLIVIKQCRSQMRLHLQAELSVSIFHGMVFSLMPVSRQWYLNLYLAQVAAISATRCLWSETGKCYGHSSCCRNLARGYALQQSMERNLNVDVLVSTVLVCLMNAVLCVQLHADVPSVFFVLEMTDPFL